MDRYRKQLIWAFVITWMSCANTHAMNGVTNMMRGESQRSSSNNGSSMKDDSDKEKKFYCVTCENYFKNSLLFLIHRASYTREKLFMCRYGRCDKRYGHLSSRTRHESDCAFNHKPLQDKLQEEEGLGFEARKYNSASYESLEASSNADTSRRTDDPEWETPKIRHTPKNPQAGFVCGINSCVWIFAKNKPWLDHCEKDHKKNNEYRCNCGMVHKFASDVRGCDHKEVSDPQPPLLPISTIAPNQNSSSNGAVPVQTQALEIVPQDVPSALELPAEYALAGNAHQMPTAHEIPMITPAIPNDSFYAEDGGSWSGMPPIGTLPPVPFIDEMNALPSTEADEFFQNVLTNENETDLNLDNRKRPHEDDAYRLDIPSAKRSKHR